MRQLGFLTTISLLSSFVLLHKSTALQSCSSPPRSPRRIGCSNSIVRSTSSKRGTSFGSSRFHFHSCDSSNTLGSSSPLSSLTQSTALFARSRRRTGRKGTGADGGGGFERQTSTTTNREDDDNQDDYDNKEEDDDDDDDGMDYYSSKSSPPAMMSNTDESQSIYSLPALYDLAFGFRDYEEEVGFLLSTHSKVVGKNFDLGSSSNNNDVDEPKLSILELGAGPARHSIAALERFGGNAVEKATCVDLSPEMAEYAMDLAVETLQEETKDATLLSKFNYRLCDMRTLSGLLDDYGEDDGNEDTSKDSELFDSAWLLLGSLQHLTDNADVIACFQSVHRVLKDKGTFILELPHPKETFSMVECTRNGWEVPLQDTDTGEEYGELRIIWGDNNDKFDPITQVRQFTVTMQLKSFETNLSKKKNRPDDEILQNIRQIVPMRMFTAQEIDAIARCTGFRVAAMYGALDEEVSVNDEDTAYRMVCVLQK